MIDKTCLAEGLVIPDIPDAEGNKNIIVAGATGCGKSVSVIYSKLLHTYETSIIVPIAKADVMKKFSVLMPMLGGNDISLCKTFPSITTEPLSGTSKPAIALKSIVLPEPLCP